MGTIERFQEFVESQVERERLVIERACEMSLVDPHGRGVLVDAHGVPSLATEVPWGEIHYMPRVFDMEPFWR